MRNRVKVEVDLGALQGALGEWPTVGDVVKQLDIRSRQSIHNALSDGRLRGIRTRAGWIIHPESVEEFARRREE